MMKRSLFLHVFLLVLFVVPVVSAVTVQRIEMTNCGLTSAGPLTCGQNIQATCKVLDTFGGAPNINSVTFTIGGTTTAASLLSGSVTNGTWGVTIPVTATTPNSSIQVVSAQDSAGHVCSASSNLNAADCFVNFTSVKSYTADCDCTFNVNSVCGTNNVATVTHTAGSGCSEASYTTTAVCDYCDPQWVAQYTTCDADRYSATPFIGTATKTYSSSNPSCCLQTGLASDCTSPMDSGSSVQCKMDYWSSAGKNTEGNSQNQEVAQTYSNTSSYTKTGAWSTGVISGGRSLRPLVFDADNDGRTEAIVFTDIGFQLYTERLGSAEDTVVISHDIWEGQPGLFGFNNYGMINYVWDVDVQDETYGVGVAGIRYDVGTAKDYFVSYRYEGGSWVLKQNIDLGLNTVTAQGVSCWLNDCYFLNDNNNLVKVNALTGSSSSILLDGTSSSNIVDAVPVFGGFGSTPQFVAVEGRKTVAGPSYVAALFVCNLALSSCTSVNTPAEIGAMSRLAVGTSPTVNRARVYYAYNFTDTQNVSHGYVAVVEVSSGLSVVDQNAQEIVPFAEGSVSACVSDVATARCSASVNGVAVAAGFTGATGSVESTLELNFDFSSTPTPPFSALQESVGSIGTQYFSTAACSGNTCFMMRGPMRPGFIPTFDSSSLAYDFNQGGFYSIDGQNWLSVPENPNVSRYIINGTVNSACNVSDGILAYGSMDGEFYMFYTKLTKYRGESVPAPSGRFTTITSCRTGLGTTSTGDGQNEYDGVYVSKFSTTSGWSVVGVNTTVRFDNGGSASSETWMYVSRPKYAMCDDDRCWMEVVDESARHNVLHVTSADVFSVSRPATLDVGYEIGGYAVTSSAKYYAMYDATNYLASNFLVRYSNAAPTTPVTLEVVAATKNILGLAADPTVADTVFYALIPSSTDLGGGDPACTQNTSAVSSGVYDDIFASSQETIVGKTHGCIGGYYSCGGANTMQVCTNKIRKSVGGGIPSTHHSETAERYQSGQFGQITCCNPGGIGYLGGPLKWGSVGKFDVNGKYYATYVYGLQGMAGGYYSQSPNSGPQGGQMNPTPDSADWVYEVFSIEGMYHPWKLNYPSVDPSSMTTYSSEKVNADSLVTCTSRLMTEVSGPGCRPYFYDPFRGATAYTQIDGGSGNILLNHGVMSGPRSLRKLNTVQQTIMDVIGVGSSGVADYVEYGCYDYTVGSGFTKVWSRTESGYSCEVSIAATDVNADSVDEIVAPSGVYSAGTKRFSLTSASSTASVVPVDISSDTYTDFLIITSTVIRSILSNPQQSIALTTNLSITGALCTFDEATRSVTAIATGVGASNPGWLTFSGKLYLNGLLLTSSGASATNEVTFGVLEGGEYNVSVTVNDILSGEQVSSSCVVAVPLEGLVIAPPVGVCSLDPDGEFNYVDGVVNHDWLPDINGRVPTTPATYARFTLPETLILHGLTCADRGLSVTSSVKMVTTSANTKIIVEGNLNGLSNTIGGVIFKNGNLYMYDSASGTGETEIYTGLPMSQYNNVTMEFDTTTSVYTVSVNGELKGSTAMLNRMNGEFSAVSVRHVAGTTDIDYIRIGGTTGIIRETMTDEENEESVAKTNLRSCVASSERDFSVDPSGTTSFDHVEAYCVGLQAGKSRQYCDFSQLREAVKYNGDCYKEVFDYCVAVTYPRTGGFEDDNVVSDQSKTMDGAAACSLGLGASVGVDRIARPFWKVLWLIFKQNWLMFIVIFFLLGVWIAAANKRGR